MSPLRPARLWLNHRDFTRVTADALAWALTLTLAAWAFHDYDAGAAFRLPLVEMIVVAVAAQLATGWLTALYRGRHRYGSFDEIRGVFAAAVVTGAAVMGFGEVMSSLSRLVLFNATAGAFACMAGFRYAWRLATESRRSLAKHARRVLVFGAGEGGAQVVNTLLSASDSPYLPVAVLDDDPRKRNLRIRNVRVVGTRHAMHEAARRWHAEMLVVAVPSADGALIRDLTEHAESAGLEVRVLPPVGDLIDGTVHLSDIRDLDLTDLLGRRPITTDVATIAAYMLGKRVLVTGAGGSIGSELCKQINQYGPAELIMLDRDESALHALQLALEGHGLLDCTDLELADIRDPARMRQVFEERRPHVVFHAAALKHLPLLEEHPGEGVQTNVHGTLTVLEAAAAVGVERFVNISSDKAAAPTNVLGYTKRITEMLTADAAAREPGAYLSVRFGNVLGSRGSVLDTFSAQLRTGGPLTVTHPEVTRYFMTVQEAVELVIQAGGVGRSGEILVLDMGEPVRIADVAERLAARAGRRIDIVYTGLRPAEKLHEVLLDPAERPERPFHPMISHVRAATISASALSALDATAHPERTASQLRQLCGLPERRRGDRRRADNGDVPERRRGALRRSSDVRRARRESVRATL